MSYANSGDSSQIVGELLVFKLLLKLKGSFLCNEDFKFAEVRVEKFQSELLAALKVQSTVCKLVIYRKSFL